MNKQNFILTTVFLFNILTAYTQKNPANEILVFFSNGTSQETELIDTISKKKLSFPKKSLKRSLNTLGIPDSLMHLALPDFNRADTVKILPTGKKLTQPDMSKLVRIRVPKGKKRKELINQLNQLPEVLYAEPNGRAVPQLEPSDTHYQADDQWG